MRKYFFLVASVLVVTMSSCGNGFNIREKLSALLGNDESAAVTDTTVSVASGEDKAVATKDLWTEEAVADQVRKIYSRVNEEISKPNINFHKLDSLFCSKDYLDLYGQVVKAEKGKDFDDLCFIEYQPFDQGLSAPIKVTNIRSKLLTGDQAEVFFELEEENSLASCTLGFIMYLEDGAWKVHDFLDTPGDYSGMWDYMQRYLEKQK